MNSVPVGYKQTEVGVIPEDWNLSTVGDNTKWMSGGTPSRNITDYWSGNIPWISGSTLKNLLISTSDQFLTIEAVANGSKMAPTGATLLLVRGSALHNEIRAGLVVSPVAFNQDVKALVPGATVEPKFLTLYILGRNAELLKLVSSAGNSAGVLDTELVQRFIFLKPPIAEQRAIVNALSDADALIQSLQKLIAKKRQIKQGTMQTLLNPYENGVLKAGWVAKPLGNFLGYEQPTKYLVKNTEYHNNNDVPVLTAGKTFILGYTNETSGIYEQELPVIIFDDFTTATQFVDFPFKAKSSAMKILKKQNPQVNVELIYQIMQRIDFPLGDHKRHWISEYQHLTICVPIPKDQNRLAEILSNMDAEITALESKLAKYQKIKQGMMQNLLTGRIRLV